MVDNQVSTLPRRTAQLQITLSSAVYSTVRLSAQQLRTTRDEILYTFVDIYYDEVYVRWRRCEQ